MSAWTTVAIKDVARVVGGATPKSGTAEYWDGDIPWTTPKDLSNLDGKYLADTPRKITDAGLRNCSAELLPAQSVLFSSRAPIGHVAINTVPMATNQGFKSFIPGPLLDASFLFWWLKCHRAQLEMLGNGATFKEVSKAIVERIEIPLPPLAEQKLIATILDQADELRRKRQRTIDLLNHLGQAVFYDMFGDPSNNPKNWPLGTIGDLAASTQYGTSGKAGDVGSFPILRMGNLSFAGEISLKNMKYIDFPERDVEKYTVQNGDILFNRTNSPDLVGKTAVYYGNDPIGFAGYLIRLRVNELTVPEYVSAYLNSPFGKKMLRGMCKAIIGMANINAQELRSISIPIPPIELQRRYQAKVKGLRAAIDVPMSHQTLLQKLFESLQNRAFNGELSASHSKEDAA
jgi:type I restriction enzyme S subunit